MRSTEQLVAKFFARVDSFLSDPLLTSDRGYLSAAFHMPWAFTLIGWCQESSTDGAVIPGFAELARRRFNYKLVSAVGRWLYKTVRLNIREARKAKTWGWYRFRASRFCHLYVASIGFNQLIKEMRSGFNDGQNRTLDALSRGISNKLIRLERVLQESKHVERWRKTPQCEHWNSVHPLANFLGK